MKIPDYNVLHIGPEHDEIDKNIALGVKRAYLARIIMGILSGFVIIAIIFTYQGVSRYIKSNNTYISTLIDEVGQVRQDNLILSNQVQSQEAVLQSLEEEFSTLFKSIEDTGGDISGIESIFGSLFASKEQDLNLNNEVVLAEEDDTLDILILGTNGIQTDTIMIASINKELKKLSLFSIPRDLYINGRRINTYYTLYGVEQLKRMVKAVTGLQIDKYVQVDLTGFMEVVDIVGALEIKVEKSIYDSYYPNAYGGYEPYYIEAGTYLMDGQEALKYARSRKSSSDFDRALRQQVILEALKEKILQLGSSMEMKELTELFQAALAYTNTDITLLDLVGYYYDYRGFEVESGFVLSTSNYLYSMINESGAYILLPKGGNYIEIQSVIDELVH